MCYAERLYFIFIALQGKYVFPISDFSLSSNKHFEKVIIPNRLPLSEFHISYQVRFHVNLLIKESILFNNLVAITRCRHRIVLKALCKHFLTIEWIHSFHFYLQSTIKKTASHHICSKFCDNSISSF